jgi:hypothetical protein
VVDRKEARKDMTGPLPPVLDKDIDKDYVQSRMLSLLAGKGGVKTLDLPKPASNDPRPFEVVGIPLAPGFHVVEIASQKLGASLLDERHGERARCTCAPRRWSPTWACISSWAAKTRWPGSPRWTRANRCRAPRCACPTAGQRTGQRLDRRAGHARIEGLSSDPSRCSDGNDDYGEGGSAYFVSARHTGADGVEDMAFTWSDWQRGIEPWRFNVPTSSEARPDERAHTMFDRTLLRAGETVSMKHCCALKPQGFACPPRGPTPWSSPMWAAASSSPSRWHGATPPRAA